VVPGNDVERATRLLRMIRRWISERRAAGGLAHHSGDQGAPQIAIVLDGYEVFSSEFDTVEHGAWVDAVPRMAAEGRAMGVHFLIGAVTRRGCPGSLYNALESRIILRQSDPDEYASFGLRPPQRGRGDLPPGRGHLETGHEVQIAVLSDREPPQDALATIVASLPRQGHRRAPTVGSLPGLVPYEALPASLPGGTFVVGLGDDELQPVGFRMEDGPALVVGPPGSGRSTLLRVLARSIARASPSIPIHLLSAGRSALAAREPVFGRAATGIDACVSYLRAEAWNDVLRSEPTLVMLVDDADELADDITAANLATHLRRRPPPGIWFVAAMQTLAVRDTYADWLSVLRRTGHGIVLDADPDADADILNARLPRAGIARRVPGRGFLIRRGTAQLLQVADPNSSVSPSDDGRSVSGVRPSPS
jgi:S-DNA-T family DNA segregation ATPase FtsK/SpoIIIE